MKNILYLHAGAELYGADIILYELIKGLDKKTFKVHVILPNDGPLVKKLESTGAKVSIVNYPILRRKYFNPKGIIKYLRGYRTTSKQIVDYCKKNNIDIVHINTSAVLEGCFIKKKLNVPVIWHIHEILTSPKIVVRFMFKKIAKYADKIVCVSKATRDNFIKITDAKEDKIEIIYNGVDNKIFNPKNKTNYLKEEFKIKDTDTVVGMIGRVNAWKGQKNFIAAMEKVLEKNPNRKNIKAMLVGGVFEGQEWRMDELKNIIDQSKYKDNFILSDFRKDTPNIHNFFDIFVLPSTSPDPLPTVVLEAMATGKPIVGYKHGGIKEMVSNSKNGILVEPCKIDKLSEAINMLISNKKLINIYGKSSLSKQKNEYSLNSFIARFEKIYTSIKVKPSRTRKKQ